MKAKQKVLEGISNPVLAGLTLIVLISITGCKDIQKTLVGQTGPSKVIAFGYIRPVSCTYEGDFLSGAGYECVMRNFSDSPRKSDINCISYDEQGRIIGRAKTGAGLTRIVFNAGEERIGRLYFYPKASLAACADIQNSIPPYADAMKLASDPTAKDFVSELVL